MIFLRHFYCLYDRRSTEYLKWVAKLYPIPKKKYGGFFNMVDRGGNFSFFRDIASLLP